MFTIKDIDTAIPSRKILQKSNRNEFLAASIDSRTIKDKELFFAIRGTHRDGHDFVEDALKAGAAGVVVDKFIKTSRKDTYIIRVPNSLKAMQNIAHFVRNKYNPIVIAITGSTGKTTTKDLIAHVLSHKFKTQKSYESYNNQYGIPLTMLKLDPNSSHLVLEIGANICGEIDAFSKIAAPDIGIITNIGYAHIGHFGTLENTLKEKSNIAKNLRPKATLILNGDDQRLLSLKRDLQKSHKIVTVGKESYNTIYATKVFYSPERTSGIINYKGYKIPFSFNLIGEHLVYTALFVSAVAVSCQMEPHDLTNAINGFSPTAGRFEVFRINSNLWIIDDTYNSSPDAIFVALRTLKLFKASRRIAILGEMRELGEYTEECHKEVGKEVANSATHLIAVSSNNQTILESAINNGFCYHNAIHAKSAIEALKFIKEIINKSEEDSVVLVKGSRFTHMERVVLGLKGHKIGCRLNICEKYIKCVKCPLLEGN